MTKNLQTQYAEALTAKGEKQELSRSSRYLKFTRAAGGYYFIGKAGSLRFGPNKTASIPCSDVFKKQLLQNMNGA